MYTILMFISLPLLCCGYKDPYEQIIEMLGNIKSRQSNISDTTENPDATENSTHKIADFEPPDNPNLNKTFFCDIEQTYQVMATEVDESDYPWIARVVHSLYENVPMVCTAAAIKEMIFITAAACLATSKVSYSTVLYQRMRLRPKAFVVPSNPTKQLFDDIGLVVVHHNDTKPNWAYIKIIDIPRTDDNFAWFESLHLGYPRQRAIGFVNPEGAPYDQNLYMLDEIFASNYLCNRITGMTPDSNDYWVPCYHHCTVREHFANSDMCEPYLVGKGHVLLDNDSTLIGVATWACEIHSNRYSYQKRLPVGIAIPNSNAYYEDLECAIKIRNSDAKKFKKGYYKNLCGE